MKGKMGDDQRIKHILEAINEIQLYTKEIDLAEFRKTSVIKYASIKQLEIIGEAAKNISEKTRMHYPGIAWKQISGLRNILVHEYFGIDAELIWQIIKTDIPDLKTKLS